MREQQALNAFNAAMMDVQMDIQNMTAAMPYSVREAQQKLDEVVRQIEGCYGILALYKQSEEVHMPVMNTGPIQEMPDVGGGEPIPVEGKKVYKKLPSKAKKKCPPPKKDYGEEAVDPEEE